MQFSSLGNSKMEISETDFFDTLTIQNDQISYVKHVLAPLHVFFTLFGCGGGGGGSKGFGAHNLLMQFCGLGSSKMEFSETDFFHTSTIQNDQMSYVKHVLAPPYVFLTLFGCWGGGGSKGFGAQPAYEVFAALARLPSLRCLAEGNRIQTTFLACPPPPRTPSPKFLERKNDMY